MRSPQKRNHPAPPVRCGKPARQKSTKAKNSLRFGSKLLHYGIGRAHERTDVIALIKNDHATVIDTHGTVLGEYKLDPKHRYQHKMKNT